MYCIVRYEALVTHRAGDTPVVAICKEWREPDEWGDPGRLQRRQLIGIEGSDNQGPGLFRQLTAEDPRTQGGRGLRLVRRLVPFEWGGAYSMPGGSGSWGL